MLDHKREMTPRVPFLILLAGFITVLIVASASIGPAQPPIPPQLPPQLPTERVMWTGNVINVYRTNIVYRISVSNGLMVTNGIEAIAESSGYELGVRDDGVVIARRDKH
jgi:hypothetical protein